MSDAPWLVVIDPQRVFADPASQWAAPGFADIVEPVRALVDEHRGRTIVTRWVPPAVKIGSWVPYFETYRFADRAPQDPLFDLVPEIDELAIPLVVSEPTFGKWGQAMQQITGVTPQLLLTGVATDCCVLSTALAAADAGASVRVLADACAGSDETNHARALAAMDLYAPQIIVER